MQKGIPRIPGGMPFCIWQSNKVDQTSGMWEAFS